MRAKSKPQTPQSSSSDRKEVTMKSLRNRMLVITAFALAAVCASATPVSAQNAFQGSFTLSHEVQWQNATLPAGAYTFEMKSVASPALITLHGPNGYQFITALVVNQRSSERSMLMVQQRNGKSIVSDLYLAEIGRCLRYPVPKSREDAELAQAPAKIERIQVAVNVK
jgi:hypothetical protein